MVVQGTLILIALFGIAVNYANGANEVWDERKTIENCTLADLQDIDKQYELMDSPDASTAVKNYEFVNCDLSTLPNELFIHVPHIRSIAFRNANISELQPFALSGLTELEVLTISGNANLTRLKTYATSNMIHLRELNLNDNGIQDLDTYALRRYTKLMQLDLNNNQLTEIPVGFFDFSLSIEILNFARNALKRIDSFTFKPLLRLLDLNLSNNRIAYIDPYAFATTARLEYLRLDGNQIRTLGSMVFHNLVRLEYLGLSENALTDDGFEDDIFQQNIELSELNISHNALITIKGMALANLKFLDASFNNLTHLVDNQFENSTAIQTLHLSNNSINSIEPLTFGNLTKLKILDLAHNHLDASDFIENITGVEVLNLSENRFKDFNFTLVKNIESVYLLNNPWNCTWLIKAMTVKHQLPNIILGLKYNDITDEVSNHPIAEEIECMNYSDADNQPTSKNFIFIHSHNEGECLKKADKKKISAINTYPRTFSKLLSDEFDYKACLLWSLFAVCLVIGLIRMGRYYFDQSERKSEQYRIEQEEKSLKEYEDYFANQKRP